MRAVARFLSRTRQQQALEFWDQLAQREALTREDLRDEAAVALVNGELGRAAAAIEQLLADDGKTAMPHDWLLAAQLRLQQDAPEKALDSLGKIFGNATAIPREQFQAALLQLQAARTGNADVDQQKQTEAWQRLKKLAEGDDAVALDALVLFAQRTLASQRSEAGDQTSDPGLPTSDLIGRLEAHPLAKAPQKLLALDLRLRANPEEKESLVRQAIEQWKNAETSQLVVLATWLNGKGEFQRQLDEIPEERALGSRELFLQRMDALGALGRWDEIRHLLESERFPLDQVMQRMYMARTNAQLGNEAAAKNNWERALEAANGDAGKLMALAEYAEKNGASEIAEAAYTQSAAAAPKLRAAWQGELRMVYAKRETKSIHTVLAEMLKLWPNDTAIQNDEAYTRLLLLSSDGESHSAASGRNAAEGEAGPANAADNGESRSGASGRNATGDETASANASDNSASPSVSEELIEIEKLADALVKKEPASLPHRTLLALALLRQKRPVAALEVYSGISVATNALTPSALAVHAAVLAANDQREAAKQEIAQAPVEKLLPEEEAGTANLRE